MFLTVICMHLQDAPQNVRLLPLTELNTAVPELTVPE
jgi:hypothetical protein